MTFSQVSACHWDNLTRDFRKLESLIMEEASLPGMPSVWPLHALSYVLHSTVSCSLLRRYPLGSKHRLALASKYARAMSVDRRDATMYVGGAPVSEPLRIGLVSSDFNDHPVSRLLLDPLKYLNQFGIEGTFLGHDA